MDIPEMPKFLKDLRDRLIHFQTPENQDIPRNKPSSLTDEQVEELPFAPQVVFRHCDYEKDIGIGIWDGGNEIRWWSYVSSHWEFPPLGEFSKDEIQTYFKVGIWIRL
jgi:hypothetical protein